MFGGDLLEGTTTSAFAMPSLDAPDNSFLSTGNLGFFTQEQMNGKFPALERRKVLLGPVGAAGPKVICVQEKMHSGRWSSDRG